MSKKRERGELDSVGRACDALEEILREAEADGLIWECDTVRSEGGGRAIIVIRIGLD